MKEKTVISEEQYLTTAAKAVRSYINAVFPTFFYNAEIEDIISDVVERILKAIHKYDPEIGAFSTWVGTIARNWVRTAARVKKRDSFICYTDTDAYAEMPSMSTDDYSPDRDLMLEDTRELMFKVITNKTDREILEWRINGLDTQAISEMTGLAPNAVYVRTCRIRKRLRSVA